MITLKVYIPSVRPVILTVGASERGGNIFLLMNIAKGFPLIQHQIGPLIPPPHISTKAYRKLETILSLADYNSLKQVGVLGPGCKPLMDGWEKNTLTGSEKESSCLYHLAAK